MSITDDNDTTDVGKGTLASDEIQEIFGEFKAKDLANGETRILEEGNQKRYIQGKAVDLNEVC